MRHFKSATWAHAFLAWMLGTAVLAGRSETPNLLVNPSFEEGRKGWSWREASPYWHDFDISSSRAQRGKHSAHLHLASNHLRVPRIWGIVQTLPLQSLPETLDLWYRVEHWRQPVVRQYIQVVVMVHREPHFSGPGDTLRQVRYILGGLDVPPYQAVTNSKYRMVGPKVPKQGVWMRFTTNVLEDFRQAWGQLPGPFSKVEVFFEVRYDDPIPAGKVASADVYWDDIHITP